MSSNVGDYIEASDQRPKPTDNTVNQKHPDFKEGKNGEKEAHNPIDPKDERSIANRLAKETKNPDGETGDKISKEAELSKIDATLPAKMNGNEPSKGAKIDQELREEEEAELKKKGKFGPKDS